jgi:hypothetical protein
MREPNGDRANKELSEGPSRLGLAILVLSNFFIFTVVLT